VKYILLSALAWLILYIMDPLLFVEIVVFGLLIGGPIAIILSIIRS
jgi:hypothetical protein